MKLQVGVKILIQNTGRQYLFLQRSQAMDHEEEPHWDMPGGRIETTETLQDALQREIFEETGLQIDDAIRLIHAQDIFVAKADLHVVRLTYTAQGDGEVTLSEEHQDAKWLTFNEAMALNLDPYLREVVAMLDKES